MLQKNFYYFFVYKFTLYIFLKNFKSVLYSNNLIFILNNSLNIIFQFKKIN